VQALRRPEVRGQWGELTLRRLVELAGMVQHCDFYEQEHTATETGAIRPDMIVRMPGGREIVVDVKTPLDAYISAFEAPDDATRRQHLERHSRKVRERVQELAGKAYWSQFKRSPDFVVLFIPGEQFLGAALDHDPGLLEEALSKKVILATPTSLVALLRAIAFGWNQQAITENAERIRDLGEDLYKRLTTFGDHLAKVGRQLGGSLEAYNKAVGSYERQVLPGARKFTELGISGAKTLDTPEQIEQGVRRLAEENASD
jgi:DNA recombination protein RmuC